MRSHSPLVQPHPGEPSQLLALPENLFYMNHMPVHRDTAAHHHHSLEMVFVVKGTAIHRTTFGDAPCKPGEIYLIPPGVWHAYAGCRDLELYNCQLSPALLNGPLAWAAEDVSLGLLLKPDPWHGSQVLTWELPRPAQPDLRGLLVELLQVFEKTGTANRGRLVARLLLLLDFVAQRGRPTHAPSTERIHSAVLRAAHALRSDLARAWALPELADELHINASYLVRIFRQATGCAPMKFLARERAQRAAQLLLTSQWSVSEIGAHVGWDEPKQFARSFHQHFGESATAFRRRLGSPKTLV